METLKSICIAAAAVSLFTLLLPEREGVRRAAITAFSLLFLLLLVPKDGSFSLQALFPSEDEGAEIGTEAYEEHASESAKAAILADLCERFSLSPDAVSMEGSLSLSENALVIDSLTLYLYDENFFANANTLLRYIEKNYTERCEVHFVRS